MRAFIKTHYCIPAMYYSLILLVLMAGCAPMRAPVEQPIPEPSTTIPPAPPEAPEAEEPVAPRYRASLQLTDQARSMLKQERFDDAIRTLERALSLYPQNGQSYYYMAEAWLEKGNISQAAEFNRLAAMYLSDPEWEARIHKQRIEIESVSPGR